MSDLPLSQVLPGAFPVDPPRPRGGRNEARQQRKRNRRRRRRSLVIILLTALFIGGAVAGGYQIGLKPLLARLTEPKDYAGPGTDSVQVKIPVGATGRTIARVLEASDVVKTQGAFLDAAASNPRSTRVQPGTYQLRHQMTGAGALNALLDPQSRMTVSVTVPEGTRAKDTLRLIVKGLGLKEADVRAAAKSRDLGLPKAAKGKLEGYLYPATYEFPPDVSAEQVLRKMIERGTEVYEELGISERRLRETVIKASIIQAEAGNQKYMGKVARVLDNRLEQGMKLQLDSTVSYATGKFNVTTTSADRASSSRYNTYRYAGLPQGPISNPGEDALKAVLDPTPGPWLFFVTTNPSTGETKFATDQAGHAANVTEFQQWLRAH